MASNPRTTPIVYRDIDLSFEMHPVTRDVAKKTNAASVVQSIKNLVMTSAEEFLMEPDIGGGINSILFQNNTPLFSYNMQKIIEQTIKNHEPRCELNEVDVYLDDTGRGVYARIKFSILNISTPFTEEILLRRFR